MPETATEPVREASLAHPTPIQPASTEPTRILRRERIGSLWVLEPLWVSGLGLALVLAVHRWLPGQGKPFDWLQYKIFGAAFPFLVLAIMWLSHGRPRRSGGAAAEAVRGIRLALALFFVLYFTRFCLSRDHLNRYLVVLSLAGMLLLWHLDWKRRPVRPALLELAVYTLVLLVAWTAAIKMSWWNPVEEWTKARRLPAFPVLCLIVTNVCWRPSWGSLRFPLAGWTQKLKTGRGRAGVDAVALVILGLFSIRHDFPYSPVVVHHLAFYAGPAAAVRQGGWLLWDVPSQYGFLDILLIALTPIRDIWQSLYVVNSLLLFASACLLYLALRLLRDGLNHAVFALAVTIGAVFLAGGDTFNMAGPHQFPSSGAMRFIWCSVLLTILCWQFHAQSGGTPVHRTRLEARIMVLGCFAWLAGTLWSAESAVYCAFIWVPSYALLALHHATVSPPTPAAGRPCRHFYRRAAGWLMLPPGLLLATLGGMTIVYMKCIGQPPDWRCFYEYSVSYGSGFGAAGVDANGAVWVLILVACALLTVAAHLTFNVQNWPAWSLLIGSWGAVWSTASYFMGRSYASNVSNLCPVFGLACTAMLLLLARRASLLTATGMGGKRHPAEAATGGAPMPAGPDGTPRVWENLVRLSFVPVYATFLLVPVACIRGQELRPFLSSLHQGFNPHVESKLPKIDGALASLFTQAGVQPGDAICVIGQLPLSSWPSNLPGRQPRVTMPPQWIPAVPLALLMPLTPARRTMYMERFTARSRRSGWLVRPKVLWDTMVLRSTEVWFKDMDWFYDQISHTHRATKRFENKHWTLIWFQYKNMRTGRTPNLLPAQRNALAPLRQARPAAPLTFQPHA